MSLFTWAAREQEEIKQGDIVEVDFAPYYGMRIPLCQVRFIEVKDDGRTLAYCHSFPYGAFPSQITWHELPRLTPTGVSWPVPDWDLVNVWSANRGQDNTYIQGLNLWPGPNGLTTCPTCEHNGIIKTWKYGPYEEEKEAVRMLDGLVDWRPVHHCSEDQEPIRSAVPGVLTQPTVV